jgi:predicted DNA binding CopG/RHH family protein
MKFNEHAPVYGGGFYEKHMPKPIPEFENEDEDREFWATHDSTDYIDWDQAERVVFPKPKPSTKTISLRLSESMLNEIRLLANKQDVPYQSLIKVFLRERIDKELYKLNT